MNHNHSSRAPVDPPVPATVPAPNNAPSHETLLDAESADAVLKRDLINTLKKVEAGKPLTSDERDRMKQIVRKRERRKIEETADVAAGCGKKVAKFEQDFYEATRRMEVYELRLAGFSLSQIAKEMQVKRETVSADLRFIDRALRAGISPEKAKQVIQERLMDFATARRLAMQEFRASAGTIKAAFLNTFMVVCDRETALLQDAGLICKAPLRLEHTGPDGKPIQTETKGAVTIADLNDDELAMLEKAAERRAAHRRN